ncbi:MAG: hypothetical protein E7369_02470 [Clostridiales bacterium]|nr:hypothetical protein [Clostridiales bacterium]
MKNLKSLLKTILLTIFCVIMVTSAFACGDKPAEEVKSGLSGTFTYNEALGADKSLKLTDSVFNCKENRGKYLLTTVYPVRLDVTNGTNQLCYTMDQRLKLNKNFTYVYEYTIDISNPNDWGGKVGRVAVQMLGTFEYVDDTNEDGIFMVNLSNPTGGEQEIYSFDVTGSGSYGYSMHTTPDAVFDLGFLASQDYHAFDKYTCGREVVVNKPNKSLSDDVFFYDVMDLLAMYSRY